MMFTKKIDKNKINIMHLPILFKFICKIFPLITTM